MANQKLNATISIGATVGNTVKRVTGVSKALEGVDKEISAIVGRQKDLDKQRKILERQGKSVDHLTKEYEDLGRELDKLRPRQQHLERFERQVGSVERSVGRLGSAVKYQAAAIAGSLAAMVVGLPAVTLKVAASTEEMTRLASRTGTSVEFFSQLSYAASRFGASTDSVYDGLKEMQMRLDEFAKTGGGPAAEALNRLGISQEKAGEMTRDTAAAWSILREALSKVENPAAHQRMSDELFGGTGAEQLIELLRLSQAEYLKLGDEAGKVGTVSEEVSRRSRELIQEQNRLVEVTKGNLRTIGSELMPTMSTSMRELSQFLIDNQDNVEAFAGALSRGLDAGIATLGRYTDQVVRTVGMINNLVGSVEEKTGAVSKMGRAMKWWQDTFGVYPTPATVGATVGAYARSVLVDGADDTSKEAAQRRALMHPNGNARSGRSAPRHGYDRAARAVVGAASREARFQRPSDGPSAGRPELQYGPGVGGRQGLTGDSSKDRRPNVTFGPGSFVITANGMDPNKTADLVVERLRRVFDGLGTGGLYDGAR